MSLIPTIPHRCADETALANLERMVASAASSNSERVLVNLSVAKHPAPRTERTRKTSPLAMIHVLLLLRDAAASFKWIPNSFHPFEKLGKNSPPYKERFPKFPSTFRLAPRCLHDPSKLGTGQQQATQRFMTSIGLSVTSFTSVT